MGIVHGTTSRIRRKLAGLGRFWKVKRLIGSTIGPVSSLKPLLRSFTEQEWFWLNTEGRRQFPELRALLPGLPDEKIQSGFTGGTGDVTLREGFNAYQLFKRLFEGNVGTFEGRRTILDFGCGWGRIIRFFLKDVEGENLWGIDCFPEMIQLCEETNKFSRFKLIDPRPMTPFDGDTFDMIYCYSVFSHLSEDIHREWLDEFARILKPGGLLVATTQPREFIDWCADLRADPKRQKSSWQRTMATAFLDRDQSLKDYDDGKFCHQGTGGGGVLDGSFYGETCIPKGYVLDHWMKNFTFVDFIIDRALSPQNVIVVAKPLKTR